MIDFKAITAVDNRYTESTKKLNWRRVSFRAFSSISFFSSRTVRDKSLFKSLSSVQI